MPYCNIPQQRVICRKKCHLLKMMKKNNPFKDNGMNRQIMQTTLKNPMKCTGVGVHSGATANLALKPAAAHQGIVFVRTDITDRDNIIPAKWDAVTETRLCTVLANKAGANVSTVEHLLSALWGCGIDNAVVEIDGPEIPIMDGSAAAFVFMVECAGIERLDAPRSYLRIKKPVTFTDGDKQAQLTPSNSAVFSFEIDFASPAIGRQKYSTELIAAAYKADISRARTFGFLHEVEALRKMGLARGGSLENAIVIDGDKILNPGGLRYRNEFARHKILDAIGDLYLAGYPIIGHFHGVRAGHAVNNRLLHALFADPQAWEIIVPAQTQATRTPAYESALEGVAAF